MKTRKVGTLVADPYRGLNCPRPGNPMAPELMDRVRDDTAPDAVLFLWCGLAGAGLIDGSAPRLADAWGFTPRAVHTWHRHGARGVAHPLVSDIGVTTSELFMVATRGSPDLSALGNPPHVDSVHAWQVPGEPWIKPDAFYVMVEQVAPGPYASVWLPVPGRIWLELGGQL